MAKKVKVITTFQRQPGVFNLYAAKGDKVIVNRKGLSKDAWLSFYFQKIEDNIKNTNLSAEELYNKYKDKWDSVNLESTYIDSYGHTWKNTSMPLKEILKYLNKLISEIRK